VKEQKTKCPHFLRVDSSPFPGEASFSRQLTSEFVAQWHDSHPDGRVIERDLAKTALAPVNAEWVVACHTPESNLTPEQNALLTTSDELIAELQAADEYVFGVSMHNFSIPSSLKLWIDQVARAGKTFSYEGGAPAGLLRGIRKPPSWSPRAAFTNRARRWRQ
jgi:FMN-dependent NADH-azoreductase